MLLKTPPLQAEVLVPDDTLEHGVEEADDERGGGALRTELGALGNAARDDGRDRRGEGREKEEPDEAQALGIEAFARAVQLLDTDEEGNAVGDGIADEEVGHRRDGEIDQDLAQRIDLVLVAHGAGLEESEAAVHGEHEHRAD
jgi:hypothetical protein